jgi:hypothetical protein
MLTSCVILEEYILKMWLRHLCCSFGFFFLKHLFVMYYEFLYCVHVLYVYIQRLTHGAEPFLRSRQLCSHSKTSQDFMEPEGSLLCSQEPSTGPYPEPDQSNPSHPIVSHTYTETRLQISAFFCFNDAPFRSIRSPVPASIYNQSCSYPVKFNLRVLCTQFYSLAFFVLLDTCWNLNISPRSFS